MLTDIIAVWGKRLFKVTLYFCIQFVVLTLVAMLVFLGGTHRDPSSEGYSFFRNTFSSLGLITAPNGEPNTLSAILFFIAMSCAGLGLTLFFLVVPQLFWEKRSTRAISLAGSLFGVISGISFMGVAFTPADILPLAHIRFVLLAFRTFLVVVVFYTLAILLIPEYPKRYALIYLIFAVQLAGYIYLLTQGPDLSTAQGEIIQVTGQKIVGFTAIIIMGIQSYGAMKQVENMSSSSPGGTHATG